MPPDSASTPAPTIFFDRLIVLTVTLEPFREEGARSPLGAANCETRYEHADTIVAANDDTLTWFHWNHINSTYANDTMRSQGMDPTHT